MEEQKQDVMLDVNKIKPEEVLALVLVGPEIDAENIRKIIKNMRLMK